MPFPDTVSCLKMIIPALGSDGLLFIETTGFQEAYYQQLLEEGYHNIESIKPLTDKHMRLALVGPFVRNGIVRIPKRGCEELIAQITNPSAEQHDDLADAFSMLIVQIMENYNHVAHLSVSKTKQPGFFKIGDVPFFRQDIVW